MSDSDLAQKHCKACEGGVPPLTRDEIAKLHPKIPSWIISADAKMLPAIRVGKTGANPVNFRSDAATPATTMNEPKMATPPSRGTDLV